VSFRLVSLCDIVGGSDTLRGGPVRTTDLPGFAEQAIVGSTQRLMISSSLARNSKGKSPGAVPVKILCA
jgi:hypothetical protein